MLKSLVLFLATSAALPSTAYGAVISTIEKRVTANVPWIIGSSVQQKDVAQIEQAWRDVRTLANSALSISYDPSDVSNVYGKYFASTENNELPTRLRALYRHFAGQQQVYAGEILGEPAWDTVTIEVDRANWGGKDGSGTTDAETTSTNTACTITLYGSAMDHPSLSQIKVSDLDKYANSKMECLGSILLHELLHCSRLTSQTFNRHPTTKKQIPVTEIDDQLSPDEKVYKGRTYGARACQQLVTLDPALACRNNDNHMYFALEAYWYGRTGAPFQVTSNAGCKKDELRTTLKGWGHKAKCDVQ